MTRINKLGRVLVAVGAIALADGLQALTIDVQKARKDEVQNTEEIVTNIEYDLDLPYGSIGNAGLVQPLAVNSTNQSGIVFGSQGTIYVNADSEYGLYRTITGKLAVKAATWEDYEEGTSWYKPITPAIMGDILDPFANRVEDAVEGNLAALDANGDLVDGGLVKNDVEGLFFARYYPEGNVKSATEFTPGIKYDSRDEVSRTIMVKSFCNMDIAENDNSSLSGRVVIPPFVDDAGNGYISDDGTRYKVVGVSMGNRFGVNTNLTDIVVPTTVASIESFAFGECTELSTVLLPGATAVGDSAFARCFSLTTISLPTATRIDVYAFSECTSLAAVDFGDVPRQSVPSIGIFAFRGVPTSCKIIVPDVQYDDWTAANSWSDLVTDGYKFLRHSEWEYARKTDVITKSEFAPVANREFLMISSDRSVALAKDAVESAYPYSTSHSSSSASFMSYGFSMNLKTYFEEIVGNDEISITKVRLQSITTRLRNSTALAKIVVTETGTPAVLASSDPLQLTSTGVNGKEFKFLFTDGVILDADKRYDFAIVDATTGDALTSLRFGSDDTPVVTGFELLNNDGSRASHNGSWGGGITADCIGLASVKIVTAETLEQEETDPTVPDWAKSPDKPYYYADDISYDDNHDLKTIIDERWAKTAVYSDFNGYVPTNRTVNNKPLSQSITLTGDDISVAAADPTSVSDSIGQKIDSESVAPAWVSGTAYMVDALVTYNSVVYRCKTSTVSPHTTPPGRDTTHWEEKKVSELFLPTIGPATTLLGPEDVGLKATRKQFVTTHSKVVAGQFYTCAGFACSLGTYLAAAGYTPSANARNSRVFVMIDVMNLTLSTAGANKRLRMVVRDGTSSVAALSDAFEIGSSETRVQITFPSKPLFPIDRPYDFRFITDGSGDGTGVTRADIAVYFDNTFNMQTKVIRGNGTTDSVAGFVRGDTVMRVVEEWSVGSYMLTEAVDLATALLGHNSAYTRWTEPLVDNSQAGGCSVIHFTPSAFTTNSTCAVRAVSIKASNAEAQIPNCHVYLWIVDDNNPDTALAISEPVYVGTPGITYTFLFGASVPLTSTSQYRFVFRVGPYSRSVPVSVPIRLSDEQESEQAIYYEIYPLRRPKLSILYSDPTVPALSGITEIAD